MKTFTTILASAAIFGAVATVATPAFNNPAFASYATPEAGNTLTASYAGPQGNGNIVLAAADAGATGRTPTGG